MLKSPTSHLSKSCPFCLKAFSGLGIHLKHCSQRCGRDYQVYLSHKTIQKKVHQKSKKKPCGNCGKLFSRLDSHLRSSSKCRATRTDRVIPGVHDSSQQVTSQLSVSTHIPDEESLPTIIESLQPELEGLSQGALQASISSLSLSVKDPFNCPESNEEWQLADEHLATTVTPRVLVAVSVDEKYQALCSGV